MAMACGGVHFWTLGLFWSMLAAVGAANILAGGGSCSGGPGGGCSRGGSWGGSWGDDSRGGSSISRPGCVAWAWRGMTGLLQALSRSWSTQEGRGGAGWCGCGMGRGGMCWGGVGRACCHLAGGTAGLVVLQLLAFYLASNIR